MTDNSVLDKGERIFLWETTELAPSHPIGKADSPAQPLVTRTIISITEEAEKSRSWIYTRIGDKNTTQPATHMENPMSAQKVEQTKGERCQFLTRLFCLFPELSSVPRLGPYGHGVVTAPFPIPFPFRVLLPGAVSVFLQSVSLGALFLQTGRQQLRREAGHGAPPSQQGSQAPQCWDGAQAGRAVLSQTPHMVLPQSWLCIYLFDVIFHCQGCQQLWGLLGSPHSPPSLPSHHTGVLWCFLFLCIYPNIFFLMSRHFLV